MAYVAKSDKWESDKHKIRDGDNLQGVLSSKGGMWSIQGI